MKCNDLQSLLRRADDAAPPPLLGKGIGWRVGRRAARRQAVRTIGAGIVSAGILFAWIVWPVGRPTDGHPSALVVRRESVAPGESVRLAELTAADILRSREYERNMAEARQIDPLERLRLDVQTVNRINLDIQGALK